MRIKLLLFIVGLMLFTTWMWVNNVSVVQAACDYAAICDAPPGGCDNSCNDGAPCIVGDFSDCEMVYEDTCPVGERDYDIYGNCTCPENGGTPCYQTWTQQCDACTNRVEPWCCSPGSACGDTICNRNGGEDESNCPQDCGGAATCGDGTCSTSTETCSTCTADCGVCPAVCGDGTCDYGQGEGCNTCSADCGECADPTYCGDGSCNGGELCSTCTVDCGACAAVCGDGNCNGGETCSTCTADCGECAAACGDGVCSGFESCASCVTDCGICGVSGGESWFQVVGGSLFAAARGGTAIYSPIPTTTCVEPVCTPYLATLDAVDTPSSFGVTVTGGGIVNANGLVTEHTTDVQAISSATTRYRENYTYFYRRFSLGLSPTDDFPTTAGDAQKPSTSPTGGKSAYYHAGDMTILDQWQVAAGENITIFVNGNLTISDPDAVGTLMTVADGGFLAFIVSGNITVDASVGNATLSNATANLEGLFVADGTFTIQSTGAANDKRFVGEGTFAGLTTVTLERDLGDTNNETIAAETFVFRPDLVENIPTEMKRSQVIWQETN